MADFGLSKGLYEKMYFREDRKDGVKLPFKWMAIESLQDGVFSEKTDTVSVVLATTSVCMNTIEDNHCNFYHNNYFDSLEVVIWYYLLGSV